MVLCTIFRVVFRTLSVTYTFFFSVPVTVFEVNEVIFTESK